MIRARARTIGVASAWSILGLAWLVGTVAAQTDLGARLEVMGVSPNLVLILVMVAAWTQGGASALVFGCVGGALLDLSAAGPIGPRALALLSVAYVGVWASRNLRRPGPLLVAAAAAPATVLYAVITLAVDAALRQPTAGLAAAAELTVAASLFNAALTLPSAALWGWWRSHPWGRRPDPAEPSQRLGTITRRVQA